MWAKQQRAGFTIVELLIVVVVIAILAAITIVAYAGIQENARMSVAESYSVQIKRSPDILDATAIMSFDDCSGNTVSDSSGKNNNGTIVGTASWSSDTPNSVGCSLSFNGSTRVTTAAQIGTNFYIKSAWVKMNTCGTNNIISGDGSAFYHCLLKAGHNGAWTTLNPNINIGDGKWHHVLLKYDNGTLNMYIDGNQVAQATGQPAPSSLVNTIGALNAGNYYAGLIDDVVIIAR